MTRFLLRLMVAIVFVCIGVTAFALLAGYALPLEDEIVFTGSFISPESPDSNIYRMSIERRIDVALTVDPSEEWFAGWSHNGRKIAFVSESPTGSGIYIMDAAGQGIHSLVNELSKINSPNWSPDDRYIAYIGNDFYPQLRLLNVQTSDVQSLTDSTFAPESPIWSPDGTQIAFVSDIPLDEHKNVYTVNLKNGTVSLLAKINDFNMSPTWSPDGTQIFFVSYSKDNQQFDIYSVDIQSRTPQLLITGATAPIESPDGRYLLYQNRDLNSLNLFDMMSRKTFLLYNDNLGALSTPDWSPDGRFIIYVSYRSKSTNIYRLNVDECLRQPDSCPPEQLTHKGLSDDPRWRP